MEPRLYFDERIDAINALEHTAETALTLQDNPLNWKWVIISLHNALQSALVCTLSGTAGVGALKNESTTKMLEWLEVTRFNPDEQMPDEWLADLKELYRRAKNPDFMHEFGGTPLSVSSQQDEDVKLLNQLRRNFVHFSPKGWSIETVGLPRIVLNVTSIVEKLMLNHPANTFRLEQGQQEQVSRAIQTLRATFSSGT